MPLNPVEVVGGIAIGEGVGAAIGDVVEPQLRDLKNTQSAAHLKVPLPGEVAAEVIARSIKIDGFDPATDARYNGLNGPRLAALTQLARSYPALPEALTLWRRGLAVVSDVEGWLHYQGFSQGVTAQMLSGGSALPPPEGTNEGVFWSRLSAQQVALGIIRSIISDPGLMPVQLDVAGGAVPAYPVSALVALDEAKEDGIDRERLRVMVGEIGLPMSPQQAASAFFRRLILSNGKTFARSDYNRAVVEGDIRPEWGDAILEQARQILTAGEYAELQLRGFLTELERRRKTAQHGMSQDDSDLLFDLLGRSINVHQIVTGEARGGTYKPPPATFDEQKAGIPPAFLASLERGNLRPEYYDLAYANRYTYPSFFAVRGLMQGKVLSADQGNEVLLEMGWKPSLAKLVSDFYGQAATAPSDPHVSKAQVQLWTTIHSSYLSGKADQTAVETNLPAAGVALDAVPQVVAVWNVERTFVRKLLTPKQVKDAYLGMVINEDTGVAWTHDDARAALVGRGFSLSDADTFLAE